MARCVLDAIMRFDFFIQPLREPPLRGFPPLRKGIVIKGGWMKKSKRIIASVRRPDAPNGPLVVPDPRTDRLLSRLHPAIVPI
jgi:hypothetical protein